LGDSGAGAANVTESIEWACTTFPTLPKRSLLVLWSSTDTRKEHFAMSVRGVLCTAVNGQFVRLCPWLRDQVAAAQPCRD
jgi:hypothetical protein